MFKKSVYELILTKKLAKDIYLSRFSGDTSCFVTPGQFVDIELPGCYLRRPISVCDYSESDFDIIYKVVGKGTDILSKIKNGEKLDMLSGLGNGFDMRVKTDSPLIVGGGVGIPPLYGLVKRLPGRQNFTVILGFNSSDEAFYIRKFETLGCRVIVTTADGSLGMRGFVTDAIRELDIKHDYIFTCGPMPMLKAVYDASTADGQYSFEARMACGFGACMGCSIETKSGAKRVCKDGPVFRKEEIIW